MKALLTLLVSLLAAGTLAAGARADGLPLVGIDAAASLTVPGSPYRYEATKRQGNTRVTRTDRTGAPIASRRIAGSWGLPVVALDGTPSGLSADGNTLVLLKPRRTFPRAETPFVVLDARTLVPRRTFTLDGDFSFDAVSPDGRFIYVIEYTDPDDPTRYAVRVYDVARGRLGREPIIDPHEPDEAMRGLPLARRSSPDGRWAYTLYDGGGATPFVHALDTVGRTARCIDLDGLSVLVGPDRLYQLRLELRGEKLAVHAGGDPFVLIDTRTFATSDPAENAAPAEPASPASEPAGQENSGSDWWVLALTAAGLAGVLALALVRRRPTRMPS